MSCYWVSTKFAGITGLILILSLFCAPSLQAEDKDIEVGKETNPWEFSLKQRDSSQDKYDIKFILDNQQIDLPSIKKFQRQQQREKLEASIYSTSLISLIALNVTDYFVTREALKYSGLTEGNPLLQPFVKNELGFAVVKLGITLGNYYLMKSLFKKNKKLGWVLSIVSNITLSYVVARNLKMIQSQNTR